MTLRYKGGQITFSIAIAVSKALIEQGDNESLKVLKFGKDWTQSLFRQASATGKVIIPEGPRKGAESIYLYHVVTKIEIYNIPHQLIFNMDQTPSKYIQSSRYIVEKSASKSVAIASSGDKRTITARFIVNLAGNFLPMQLIYGVYATGL